MCPFHECFAKSPWSCSHGTHNNFWYRLCLLGLTYSFLATGYEGKFPAIPPDLQIPRQVQKLTHEAIHFFFFYWSQVSQSNLHSHHFHLHRKMIYVVVKVGMNRGPYSWMNWDTLPCRPIMLPFDSYKRRKSWYLVLVKGLGLSCSSKRKCILNF